MAVITTDRVRVLSPPDPSIAGSWQIKTVRYNGRTCRLMLKA